ncbi:MAG TPA: TerB N-terminal domain-containing protein [Anaerolineales bacterium]|nr:TerB N-terminal domain-containing protein [Anaerolineales bacterium]
MLFALPISLLRLIGALSNTAPPSKSARQSSTRSPTPATRQSTERMDRFVEVLPGGQVERVKPVVTLAVSYETNGTRFLKEAQQYRGREGKPVEPVPFMQYWPTYSSMTGDQQRWYFYWRSQVRRYNFLPTDLSYIFIHIYELLNLIEQPDPINAAGRMWKLWQHYRPQHPKLDNYLPDWGGDFLALHKGVPAGIIWWQNTLPMTGRLSDPIANVIIHRYVESGRVAEMPYTLWATLTNYRPRNKFYQEHNQEGLIDRAYATAVRMSDDYWHRTSGQSVLEKFTSTRLQAIRKPVFTSALIGYDHPEWISLGQSRNYLGEARLGDHLTSVMKYTENLLRKQMGFNRKLSGIEVDIGLAQVLDLAFALEVKQPEPIRVTLDLARVASLHEESELIGALLGEVDSASQSPSAVKPLYTDLPQMRQLWAGLELPDRQVISDVFDRNVSKIDQLNACLESYALLPNMVIARINEKALHLLGDRLLYVETDGSLILAEDFTDELDVVLKEASVEAPQPASVPSAEFQSTTADDVWDRLFSRLTPAEIALINLFAVNGSLAESEIESATRPYNVMANAALDALNEKAAECLGHPPFYFDIERWSVEDEDLVALRQHLVSPGAD